MALSEAEVQAVFARTPKECVLCKSEALRVGEALITATELDRDLQPIDGQVVFAQAVCESCGHTLLFRADLIGVLPPGVKRRPSGNGL